MSPRSYPENFSSLRRSNCKRRLTLAHSSNLESGNTPVHSTVTRSNVTPIYETALTSADHRVLNRFQAHLLRTSWAMPRKRRSPVNTVEFHVQWQLWLTCHIHAQSNPPWALYLDMEPRLVLRRRSTPLNGKMSPDTGTLLPALNV